MGARTPLGTIDHAWLRMDRPTNPMMVTGVMTFDEPVDVHRLRRTIESRMSDGLDRFRQRVVERGPARRAVWEDVPDFRVADHVDHRMLPQPADRAILQAEIAKLVSTPIWPSDRPLWRMHLLENPNDGRAVLVTRLHHCIADGFALMHVMLTLTDAEAEPPEPVAPPPHAHPSLGGRLREAVSAALEARKQLDGRLAKKAVRAAGAVGGDLLHLAFLRNQPETMLRGPLGHDKRVAWSAPMPLDEIKATGRALGGTVNDVLMTAAAGALRRYLAERGEDPSGFDLRTAVPVNLRSPAQMRELGNYFGLVFLELPLGVEDPRARFVELKHRMDALKRSPEPYVLLNLMRVTGGGPRWLEEIVIRILGAKTTAVLTNVPGPRQPRYLAGQRIRTIMFWVPQSGRVGLGVSIFSYAGEVRLGVAVDAHLVREPERIIEAFPDELEALRASV
ncbi:MAG TPA: wax ester/triacylglycerol synthase family O-acyltransferase [Sandaracinaceae bacterium LLY-WYZ-13_1]|nr:wax ester/triacylglycerol synthase family O-acyltransferase [Sandaracinaceae bacterium LLY-WYZ-13_1]